MTLKRQLGREHEEIQLPLGPAKLYLDDLEDILIHVRDFAERKIEADPTFADPPAMSGDPRAEDPDGERRKSDIASLVDHYRPKLHVGDAIAEEVDDLRHAPDRDLKRVMISMTGFSAWFFLGTHSATARAVADRDDADLRVLLEDVQRFVRTKKTLAVTTAVVIWSWLFTGFFTALAVLTLLDSWGEMSTMVLAGLWAIVAGIAATLAVTHPRKYGYARIIPQRRSEARSLSNQTRRELVIASVSVAIGTVLGALIDS